MTTAICEKCRGTGRVHSKGYSLFCGCELGRRMRDEDAARRLARKREYLVEEAGAPPLFVQRGFSFDSMPLEAKQTPAVERVYVWLNGPHGCYCRNRATTDWLGNELGCGDDPQEWPQEACRTESDVYASYAPGEFEAWDARRRRLLLWGKPGRAKSVLAYITLSDYYDHPHSFYPDEYEDIPLPNAGVFCVVPELLDDIRAGYGSRRDYYDDEEDALSRAKKAPFLVLDDIGAERSTEWAQDTLNKIIDYRHRNQLPTVLTSNLAPEELADWLGERTMWRIVENAEIVHLDGPNLRDR
jgi:hypothetical protein